MLPGAMGSSDMGRSNASADMGAGSSLKLSESTGASVEIIARDNHGEMQMVDPPSPTPDELKDVALDERQENERRYSGPQLSEKTGRLTSPGERQRLADTIKYHQQRSSMPGQPEGMHVVYTPFPSHLTRPELLEAIRASLRAKVSALADDNWMYEAEDAPRLE